MVSSMCRPPAAAMSAEVGGAEATLYERCADEPSGAVTLTT